MTESQGIGEGYEFLKDEPTDDDFFGAHGRVANAVVTTVYKSKGTRIIGLVGPWGSGKSTVAKLMEPILTEESKRPARVFVFDTWLHHGEPVRRAFLEVFLEFCKEQKDEAGSSLMPPEKYGKVEESVKTATGHTVTTRTEETPQMSVGGLVILGALALAAYGLAQGAELRAVPVLATLLGYVPAWLPSVLPLFLVAIPIASVVAIRAAAARGAARVAKIVVGMSIVSLLACLVALRQSWHAAELALLLTATISLFARKETSRARKKPAEKAAGGTPARNEPENKESIVGLLLNRQHQSKQSRVTGTPSPAASEFADAFHQARLATFDACAPLIVVVDNLDRLPATDAKEAWGMLRTFFIGKHSKPEADDRRMVVVVPVAEEAVEAMFKAVVKGSQPGTDTSTAAQSFMDKTFDVVFYLPPPLLTRWRSYLGERMTDLFDAKAAEWTPATEELMDARFIQTGETITPRRINSLLNILAGYWMQYQTWNIPFATVAYYAFNKAQIDRDILGALQAGDVPVTPYDRRWQRSLAALHFGVELGQAASVLLTRPLENAIAGRRSKEVSRLMTTDGASAVLQRIVLGYLRRATLAQSLIFDTVYALSESDNVSREIWQRLIELLTTNTQWGQFNAQDAGDLMRLIENANGPSRALVRFNNSMKRHVGEFKLSATAFCDFWDWAMTTWKPVLPALKQIFVPGSGSAFVAVASTAKLDPDLRRRLLPTNSLNVVLELVEELKKGDQVPSEVKDLRFLSVMSTAIRADWTTHFQQAHKRLMEDFVPSNIRGEYVRGVRTPLLVLAVHVGTDERAKALARDLVQQEVFSHIISFSRANGYWSELARCVAVLIGVDDVLDSSIASLQIPENHVASLERELAMVLEHSFTPGQIFGLSFATFGMPGTIGGILVKVLATLSDAASRVP